MLTFLLVVQALVAILLVGVILMQQSEGGGLGMGGSPTGLMSARGAADFLTRATTVLATLFIGLSILHAVLATRTGATTGNIDTSLARRLPPATAPAATAPSVPLASDPGVTPPTETPSAATPVARSRPAAPIRAERPTRATAPAATVSAPPPIVATTPAPTSSTAGNAN